MSAQLMSAPSMWLQLHGRNDVMRDRWVLSQNCEVSDARFSTQRGIKHATLSELTRQCATNDRAVSFPHEAFFKRFVQSCNSLLCLAHHKAARSCRIESVHWTGYAESALESEPAPCTHCLKSGWHTYVLPHEQPPK